MSKNLVVTVYDPETKETASREIGPADYILVTTEPAYLDGLTRYGNGTTVLTVKVDKAVT